MVEMEKTHLHTGMGFFVLLTLIADPAWAVQTHGGAEGLVTHQIGHLLFAFGMGYLLLRLYHIQLKSQGWFEFKIFLWLILAWNFLTFSGHWLNESITKEKFIHSNGDIVAFSITNLTDSLFYLSRLDHLILVPSFLFLLLALHKWRRQE